MINYGQDPITGEAFAESDEFNFQGKTWMVRITAVPPYKDYANGGDELLVTIDFNNITDGIKGRYENVWLPAREPGDNNLRRHSLYRELPNLLGQVQPIPSPIYV